MRRFSEAVQAFLKSRYFYPLAWIACALPGALLLRNAIPVFVEGFFPNVHVPWTGDLGVNPVQFLLRQLGTDALALLLLSLTVTPLRRLTGWNRLQLVRRTLGVWSFVYAFLHFSTYVAFDKLGIVADIVEDVFKRRFIFVGMFTFLILLALTATSTNGMIRRLGKKWQTLHRSAYVAAVAGTIHFAWGQKADISEPLQWAAFLAVLLGYRVFLTVQKRQFAATKASTARVVKAP